MPDTPNPTINENDLLVTVVRIDSRTKAMQEGLGEIKATLSSKADAATVAAAIQRVEARLDKSDEKHVESDKRHNTNDKRFNYVVGGIVVIEALLRFVPVHLVPVAK